MAKFQSKTAKKKGVGTEIRQAYEEGLKDGGGVAGGQEAVYERTTWILKEYYGLAGTRRRITG